MPADRLWSWLVTLALTAVAALVRLWELGSPTDDGTPVFDEKHYVPQAWQMLRNGGYEDNPGYELVAHPPVGKQLIALGEWALGYNPWGWRIASALAGTLMVLLIVRIGRRMTRSTMLGAFAGVLLICDGLSHVQSRVGMLDIFQAAFVLAAFACLLVDRDQVRGRLATVVAEGRAEVSTWGPRLGFRWWRFSAGLLLGLACGVKWNGLYYIVAFGLLSVFWDVLARRTAGVRRPWVGALVRDTRPALASLVALPITVYFATWFNWFASETATDRHAALTESDVGMAFLPDALRSLFYYHLNVLDFHTGLSTPANDPHPWESKPWSWPMGMRPMLYYYESDVPGCGRETCVEATMLLGTPAMWWLALPVAGWAVWRATSRMDWRYAAVLVGYGAGFLPWFTNLDRQMYYFYATPLAPFLVLGIVLVLGEILGSTRGGFERRRTGLLAVALYLGLVVANFVWLWPILNADPITEAHWQAQMWLPSWR
ncbi:phospholipid carrier-dependent glycosyltransferase [Allosaccharopolyspora coralli]|uniref:Polyprenol-phosphate-mannose--protein mannosyltransferase n=2 Tax=Allosaccharopolyspora coralli TaxID=2665642 RepID=A0A5Q3QBR8_9PSEU|nr:phospholipid carrier-dependent glycosyltransferase [Allosaccharopolyspora coralli]QGK71998.1 phospholipid carrier-dependent glycosyltransferase [Allosaccharopolyspora coralli]